jgi:hypothetical protein
VLVCDYMHKSSANSVNAVNEHAVYGLPMSGMQRHLHK